MKPFLIAGILFILLALLAASGSVSLGTFQTQSQSGGSSGSYLVYGPIFELIALGLAVAGIYFVYQSGREDSLKAIPSGPTN